MYVMLRTPLASMPDDTHMRVYVAAVHVPIDRLVKVSTVL